MAQQVKTWSQKLRDPRWQKVRLDIMERDGWRCTVCGDKKGTLNVHHVVYSRNNPDPWDYEENVLQTLCEDCHEERQELIDNAANALKISLRYVPTKDIRKASQKLFDAAMESL
jgi:5-methylcytosine-specific restriction endonuclease McrA